LFVDFNITDAPIESIEGECTCSIIVDTHAFKPVDLQVGEISLTTRLLPFIVQPPLMELK